MPSTSTTSDIANLQALNLEPRVLSRPRLAQEFIREANIRELAEAAVDIFEDIDARYTAPAPDSPSERIGRTALRSDAFTQSAAALWK